MTQPYTQDRDISSEIQDLLLDSPDVEDFLAELVRHSAGIFSTPTERAYCGITLLRHRTAATVASSDDRALMLDELQYRFDDGPCLHCAREGVLIHIPNLELDNTWPQYNDVALGQGVRSVLAVPFPMPEASAKAGLNVYSEKPHAFDQTAVQRVMDYVQQASKGLRLAVLIAQHSQTAANLRAALESRTVIDTAVGIIIAQNRCSQEEAMELIKSASSTRNVKLREVAAAIVQSASGGKVETHFT